MSSSKRSALSEPMVATRQFAPAPASIQGCSSRRSISCGSSSLAALSMRRRRVESTATVSSYTSVWVAAISKLDTSSEAVSGPRSGKRGSTRSGSGSQRSTRESAQPWLCSWMGFVIPVSSTLLRESRTVGVGTGFFSSVTPRTLQVPSVHRGNPLAVEDAVVAHSLLVEKLTGTDGILERKTLHEFEVRRRAHVEQVISLQRRAATNLAYWLEYGRYVPPRLVRGMTKAARVIVPRSRSVRNTIETFALGQRSVSVDRSHFID